MKLLVKFQSISDVITNSSSELFTIVDDRPFEEVKELVESIGKHNWGAAKDSSSGEGGKLEVSNWEDKYNDWLKWAVSSKKLDLATPEVWALQCDESLEELQKSIWISVDWNREATIDWIIKNLWVYDADGGCFEKDPNTGRVIKRITYEEAKKLPKERKISY